MGINYLLKIITIDILHFGAHLVAIQSGWDLESFPDIDRAPG